MAGREDTAWDQTVSSPLHPSASHARSPTPDPPNTDAAHWTYEPKPVPTATALSQGGGGAEKGAPCEASQQGFLPRQGSGRGSEGKATGSLQGPGKAVGPTKGKRPSTAPVSPVAGPAKIVKPTRCQKCHTCRHKQLKKQCLRNKARFLSSPALSPLQPNPPGHCLHRPPDTPLSTLLLPLPNPCTTLLLWLIPALHLPCETLPLP